MPSPPGDGSWKRFFRRRPKRPLVTPAGPVARLRDGTPVGAWLLKANPAVWDIGTFLASGVEVDRWRLAPSYRADLMAPGHPAVLWVTRGDPALEPGVRAVGVVTARGPGRRRGTRRPVVAGPGGPAAGAAVRGGPTGGAADRPVTAAEVRADPRLAGTEILRVPRLGSPVALTPEEWDGAQRPPGRATERLRPD